MSVHKLGIVGFSSPKLKETVFLVSSGILLLIIGILSKVPMTRFSALGLGAFIFYTVYFLRKEKTQPVEHKTASTGNASETADLYDDYFEPIPAVKKFEKPADETAAPAAINSSKEFTVEESTTQQQGSQNEFHDVLLHTLNIIKEVTFGHTVAFFWANNESQQLVVEASATDSSMFIAERKISYGSDIVSQIAQGGEAKIINQITAETEKDVLPYYTSLQEVKAFVGVPVFFAPRKTTDTPIAILTVDSKAEDAFGEETYAQLEHFTKLISSLLGNFTEKFDLQFDARMFELACTFQKKSSAGISTAGIINSLLDHIEQILSWETLSVVLYDESQRQWALGAVRVRGNYKFVTAKQAVDFEESLVGNCLRTSASYVVHDLSKNSRAIFYSSEPGEILHRGSMVIVPFVAGAKSYGAIVVTDRQMNMFTGKEIAAVEYLASAVALSLERLELNAIIAEHLAVDEQTGVAAKKFFLQRMDEELSRANEREEDLSLVLLSITNFNDVEQRYGAEGKAAALLSIAHILRTSIRSYDVAGRVEGDMFAILLADTAANDAFIWAEKLRSAISANVISASKKNFSVSVTIGIAGAIQGMKREELFKNANYILEQAKKAGGNMVRVF
ncbi:MAG: diguanylate cyclase [Bacteroidetes bacterium]|nr:diguanylate cyclase [Bacteroidota bacterium]